MEHFIILVFILGYLAITLEHSLKIDKLIPALIMMAFCWGIIALGYTELSTWFDSGTYSLVDGFSSLESTDKQHIIQESLVHHLGKTAEILVFLIGAMTIVEIIDYFDGFHSIQGFIKTKKKSKLLWIFSFLAFFLSAVIDNLTATIILVSILQKVIKKREDRIWFSSLIIIAANAGGAWSPIGDVTTTMLWIDHKVTTSQLVMHLLIPSLVCMVASCLLASLLPVFKGSIKSASLSISNKIPTPPYSTTMFYLGIGAIVFVPIFKTITHLPPYVGMMFSLGIVATFAEIYSRKRISLTSIDDTESEKYAKHSPVHHVLSKIEMPSILFFLGILLAVAALESMGTLLGLADWLKASVAPLGTELANSNVSDLVIMLLGVLSAVIDNVPLVAASLSMFSETVDNPLWHFIAYAAGIGGSMLIIGSAAGVVAMGMEKIAFFWYLRKVTLIAVVGFLSGCVAFFLIRLLLY